MFYGHLCALSRLNGAPPNDNRLEVKDETPFWHSPSSGHRNATMHQLEHILYVVMTLVNAGLHRLIIYFIIELTNLYIYIYIYIYTHTHTHRNIYQITYSMCSHLQETVPPWSSGSVLDLRSLPPVFEFRRGDIWRVFHLWLRLITTGGSSAHLAFHVDKSGRKPSIIIIIIISSYLFLLGRLDVIATENQLHDATLSARNNGSQQKPHTSPSRPSHIFHPDQTFLDPFYKKKTSNTSKSFPLFWPLKKTIAATRPSNIALLNNGITKSAVLKWSGYW